MTQLVYIRKAICDVGAPPGSRTWYIVRIFKQLGSERRQYKVGGVMRSIRPHLASLCLGCSPDISLKT